MRVQDPASVLGELVRISVGIKLSKLLVSLSRSLDSARSQTFLNVALLLSGGHKLLFGVGHLPRTRWNIELIVEEGLQLLVLG